MDSLAGWTLFTASSAGYTIKYPTKWFVEEAGSDATAVVFTNTPFQGDNINPTNPMITIITQNCSEIGPDQFIESQMAQLKQMANGAKLKVDRNAKLGSHPAVKAITQVSPPFPGSPSISFFCLWSVINGMGYSILYHAAAEAFQENASIIGTMAESFKSIPIRRSYFDLRTYINHGILLRLPPVWAIVPQSDDSQDGPLETWKYEEKMDEKLITSVIKLKMIESANLEDNIAALKEELEEMFVESVAITSTKIGIREAKIAKWNSDGTFFAQFTIAASNPGPLYILSLTTNGDIEYNESLFSMVYKSIGFLTDSETASSSDLNAYYHTKFKMGFLYNPKLYTFVPDLMPMTQGAFYKSDSTPSNPTCSLGIVVRPMEPNEKTDLNALAEVLQEQLKPMIQGDITIESQSDSVFQGCNCKTIILSGSPPAGSKEAEDMYFIYKYMINTQRGCALMFACTSVASIWKKEWPVLEKFIDTLHWD